jgi:hypothetical protein
VGQSRAGPAPAGRASQILEALYYHAEAAAAAAGPVHSGLDAKAVAQRATESYLIQILKHGLFHSDPHPGNLAIGECPTCRFYFPL